MGKPSNFFLHALTYSIVEPLANALLESTIPSSTYLGHSYRYSLALLMTLLQFTQEVMFCPPPLVRSIA